MSNLDKKSIPLYGVCSPVSLAHTKKATLKNVTLTNGEGYCQRQQKMLNYYY